MKTIFFEWADYEQKVLEKNQIALPEGSKCVEDTFDINLVEDQEAISIKTFSRISNADLDNLKQKGVKKIALRIAGFNMLDVDYASKIGFEVSRVAAYSPESIAEFAMALILTLARKMTLNRKLQEQGKNIRALDQMGFLLKGKKLGLHGYGKIARSLAKIARDGFGMQVSFFDPYFKGETVDKKVENLQDLYSQNQIVSVHTPLMDATAKCVNYDLLKNTPQHFMLINTSRGGVLCNDSVKKAIKEGKIEFIGVDVWGEDDAMDKELLTDKSFQSYHVAFFTEEAVYSMITQCLEAIEGKTRPENVLPITY
jgi:D-lactate dehydrogenase